MANIDRSTEQGRRAYKAHVPKIPLRVGHLSRCKVLPSREHILDCLPKGLIFAEVGVAFGDFSKQILARCEPQRLYLIDSWATKRYAEGLERIRSEFADLIRDGVVVVSRGRSTDVLATFPDASVDVVYIDTDHSYDSTLAELSLANAKLRANGFAAGHDYCNGNIFQPWPYGVIEAVAKFCNDYQWGFEYLSLELHGHYSFVLKRIQSQPPPLGSDGRN